MRRMVAVVAGVLVLAIVNWTIYARERHLAEGRVVLLELAPVDPRSLMQGDYMALAFAVANVPALRERPTDGRMIVALDARGVGRFVRRDDASPLAPGEVALRYRVRDGRVKFGSNAFFFQEGHASDYAGARYGELRVSRSGEVLLIGLRGGALEPLGAPAK